MEVDEKQINTAFDALDAALVLSFTESAIRSHIAGDIAIQKKLGMKTSFNLVKSAATEFGKDYKKTLIERGGSYVATPKGKLVFKDWFAESSKLAREEVADIINTGIKDGKGIRNTKKDLRKYFNQRKKHAEMIARTETTTIQGIATTNRLKEQGIERVQWITAEDERVRTEHAARHNQIYKVGEVYPGGFNCRCVLVGYEEEV